MSSLGYQTIYRVIQHSGEFGCERVFAPDQAAGPRDRATAPRSYESGRALSSFPIVALSVAYELEIAGVIRLLEASGLPAQREQRSGDQPLIIAGGPLTFSNPLPLGAFVDAIVMGECDALVLDVLRAVAVESHSRDAQLERLAAMPNVVVPAIDGETLKPLGRAPDAALPAWGPIRTPDTELRNMALVEAVRGCSRGCAYCVMRRSTHGGMRVIEAARVLERVPDGARRVGLVGASVSDHPELALIIEQLVERGAQVGVSSLRPDRLSERLVEALRSAGYRTLTTAIDGASERLRELLGRRTSAEQVRKVATRAREAKLERLKLYLMVGVPGEEPSDIEECAELVCALSAILPISLGISPFCPKRGTPLAGAKYAGVQRIDEHLRLLRRRVAGRAEIRATSARWGWVEAELAQGGWAQGRAVLEAVHNGGGFAAYREEMRGDSG